MKSIFDPWIILTWLPWVTLLPLCIVAIRRARSNGEWARTEAKMCKVDSGAHARLRETNATLSADNIKLTGEVANLKRQIEEAKNAAPVTPEDNMQKTRSRTYNSGARDERRDWLAKVRRMFNTARGPIVVPLQELIDYGITRQKRYDPKPGGVGRAVVKGGAK